MLRRDALAHLSATVLSAGVTASLLPQLPQALPHLATGREWKGDEEEEKEEEEEEMKDREKEKMVKECACVCWSSSAHCW